MKPLIFILGLSLGLYMGFWQGTSKPKSNKWKWIAFLIVVVTIFISFLPPIAGSFSDIEYMFKYKKDFSAPVLLTPNPSTIIQNKDKNFWEIKADNPGMKDSQQRSIFKSNTIPEEFKSNKKIIALFKYNIDENAFECIKTESVSPIFTLPLILILGERARILFYHVPVAWISVLAYLISMIYSIMYLRTRKIENDIKAASSAALGILFCLLATITGMLWAKFNWGQFWNWDPRETSIFMLLLIYFAYFGLRTAIENPETKARLSSVYSIIAFITVPFFVFVLPRITSGLHPGSQDDTSSGPILSGQSESLNFAKQIIFSLALSSFTIIYFWLFNLTVRINKIKHLTNN